MELLIITAVQSYEKDIKQLLKENEVHAFSHLDVVGYKDVSNEQDDDNWFATSAGEHQSALFYVFVESAKVDQLMKAIGQFNDSQESLSHVHAVSVEIKKSIGI